MRKEIEMISPYAATNMAIDRESEGEASPDQNGEPFSDAAAKYKQTRTAQWDRVARRADAWRGLSGYYNKCLQHIYSFLVSPGLKVLEVGCGSGDLLAALTPSNGAGIDFSSEMIKRAAQRHRQIRFVCMDAHELGSLGETFDVVILSDLLNDVWDVQRILEQIALVATPSTRVIINCYSRLWEIPLLAASRLGLSKPKLQQNWLTVEDVANLLTLANFEVIRSWQEILCPLYVPLISKFLNRFVGKLWPFRYFGLTNFIVARPMPRQAEASAHASVSVIVPARNEEGNIRKIFERVPGMGGGTELIFVEGHSKDATYSAIQKAISEFPHRNAKLLRQSGK